MTEAERKENKEREERILDAAKTLILRYGYDKTTVSDIAREAAVSKGAIYLHFDSKESLFNALVMRQTTRYTDAAMHLLEESEDAWSFTGMYKITLSVQHEYPLVMALVRGDQQVFGNLLRMSKLPILQLKRQTRLPLLQQMQEVGAFRDDLDMEVVAYVMDFMGYGMMSAGDIVPPEEAPAIDKVIEVIGGMWESYLTPEDGGNWEAGREIIMQMIRTYRAQMDETGNFINEAGKTEE